MNQSDNKAVLKCGDKFIKASEVNDFLGFSGSDSEGSDWDEIKETTVNEFLVEKQPVNKIVERKSKKSKSVVMPWDIFPENIPLLKPKVPVVKKDSKYFIVEPTRIRILGSDSEGSDWDEIKETTVNEFLVEKEPVNKIVERKSKKSKSVVMPWDIVPENIPLLKPKVPVVKKDSQYFIVEPTRIRILNPQVSSENWKDQTKGRQIIPASKLCQDKIVYRLSYSDWILVGVIVQVAIKKDKTNKNFCIWYLNDLECLDKVVKFMLFREVYEKYWKEGIGTVVAILNPKCLPKDEKFKTNAFMVNYSSQMMLLGSSPDYGICQRKKKSGESCRNIVNKGDCTMCSYHVQSGYFNTMSHPGFGNCGVDKLNERKRKTPNLPWMNNQKKHKMGGVYVNNRITSNISVEKLQQSGITARATEWGILDKRSVSSEISNRVLESDKTAPLVNLLKKPISGSMNFVKHIVERSMGSDGIASNIIKQSRSLTNPKTSNVKAVTFDNFRKKMLENLSQPEPSNQSVNLGYKPAKLDEVRAEVYRAELNKLRLAAQAKEKGENVALRERNRQEYIKKACTPVDSPSLSNKSKKPIIDDNFLKILNQGSANKKLLEIDKMANLDMKFDKMEVVEKLETKLATQHEQECILFICVQCESKTAMKPQFCVAEGHIVKSVTGFRRFFQCIKCKQRTTTYEKYPEGSCLKCGACAFEKTGKMKEREVVTEKLQIHGNEKRFISN